MAGAEVWRRAHHRKPRFWSRSIFHNVFHFSSGGLCVIWVVHVLRRDLSVREQREETQPSPLALESTRQGSEFISTASQDRISHLLG